VRLRRIAGTESESETERHPQATASMRPPD